MALSHKKKIKKAAKELCCNYKSGNCIGCGWNIDKSKKSKGKVGRVAHKITFFTFVPWLIRLWYLLN